MNNKVISIIVIACLIVLMVFEIKLLHDGLIYSIFPVYTQNSYESELIELNPPSPESTNEADNYTYEAGGLLSHAINITYENIFDINNFDIIKKNLYNVDSTAYVYNEDLDYNRLLAYDMSTDLYSTEPKILIFHTHSREGFADSREGYEEDTIVGVGERLSDILRESYGINVMHHKGIFDMKDGKEVRDGSYERMEPSIRSILAENPSIEIIIDLHRDSLPSGKHLVTEIDGRKTAMIMFFNGICRENKNGEPRETDWLVNNYLDENLALSLRMKLLANQFYPGFTRNNYIKPYRYSLHMKPKSLLIEVGSDANTVEEAKNAMIPLAQMLTMSFS